MGRLSLRSEDVTWTPTDAGSVVVLDLRTSKYLQLNDSGAALWQSLADGASTDQLAERLVAAYGIDRTTADRDVAAFVAGLRQLDLVDESGS